MRAALPGLIIVALGGGVGIYSYTRWFIDGGDSRPGMMALGCGLLLVAFGIAIAWTDHSLASRPQGSRSPEPIGEADDPALHDELDARGTWLSLALTLGAICAFAFLAPIVGVFGAIIASCVIVAVLARFDSIQGFVLFVAALSLFVYLVFVLGLQLPLKVMP